MYLAYCATCNGGKASLTALSSKLSVCRWTLLGPEDNNLCIFFCSCQNLLQFKTKSLIHPDTKILESVLNFRLQIYLKNSFCFGCRWILVWPQWWNFGDVIQQGLDFSKKSSKRKIFFGLTFTDVHMGRQKVPKSDF